MVEIKNPAGFQNLPGFYQKTNLRFLVEMTYLGATRIQTMKKPRFTLTFCLAMLSALSACGQEASNYPTIGKIVRESPLLDQLLATDARIEVLASGFEWSEGPVWIQEEGCLLFSDIPNNAIMKWKAGEGVSTYLKPAGYTGVGEYGDEPGSNGLLLDKQGSLVMCEHGDRRMSVMSKGNGKRTLVDNFQGKRLNSPNDAVYRSNGDLYFTDPPYGLPKKWDDPRRELDFCGVFRLSADGKLSLLTREMTRPNGIAFSPDEKTLYVAQSDPQQAIIRAFTVLTDGSVGKSRVFYDATPMVKQMKGLPDGLKVDAKGNLFATGPGGVLILSPEGKLLGRIDTGEATSNCAWGDDGSTLYITADMYLCRVRTKTKGAGW
jgi:gluconolactonase